MYYPMAALCCGCLRIVKVVFVMAPSLKGGKMSNEGLGLYSMLSLLDCLWIAGGGVGKIKYSSLN